MRRVLISWSSGKDSAWTLERLRRNPEVEVVGLLTVFDEAQRVPMHRTSRALVEAQAAAAGLPLLVVEHGPSHDAYATRMRALLRDQHERGVTHIAFGDLYLEDLRAAREANMRGTGIELCFPLWGSDTAALAREMCHGGLCAKLSSIDLDELDATLLGCDFDTSFVEGLPASVDPCGERGEFHSFAWRGPMFSAPIAVAPGPVSQTGHYAHLDLRAA